MRKVLVFGTFDLLHKGHFYFLKQAKKYGDFLTVVVSRDINVKMQKGRLPANDEKIRLINIRRLKIANQSLLGERRISYHLIKKINPDVICIGYDQTPGMIQAKKILKRIGMSSVVLKKIKAYKPKIYKSSLVRK